jgi:hypothetical protein
MELLIWLWSYDSRWLFGYYGGRLPWWIAGMIQAGILISTVYLAMTGCGMNYSLQARVIISMIIILSSVLVATAVKSHKVNPGRVYAVSAPGLVVLACGLVNLGMATYEYLWGLKICEQMLESQVNLQNAIYLVEGVYIVGIAVLWFLIKIGCIVCAACMPRFYIRIKSN